MKTKQIKLKRELPQMKQGEAYRLGLKQRKTNLPYDTVWTNTPAQTIDEKFLSHTEANFAALKRNQALQGCKHYKTERDQLLQQLKVEQHDHQKAVHRLLKAEAQRDELLAALNHSADKLNDLAEWLKAYAEPKQALSVKAVEQEARAAIAKVEE